MLVESIAPAPHGGHLVDRKAPDEDRKELVREALDLPLVHLDARTLSDLQMIASGDFSPLEGFMLREDYESVVEEIRLSNGLAWSMPITLSAEEETADRAFHRDLGPQERRRGTAGQSALKVLEKLEFYGYVNPCAEAEGYIGVLEG
jgi:sulfate adenylyltransferase